MPRPAASPRARWRRRAGRGRQPFRSARRRPASPAGRGTVGHGRRQGHDAVAAAADQQVRSGDPAFDVRDPAVQVQVGGGRAGARDRSEDVPGSVGHGPRCRGEGGQVAPRATAPEHHHDVAARRGGGLGRSAEETCVVRLGADPVWNTRAVQRRGKTVRAAGSHSETLPDVAGRSGFRRAAPPASGPRAGAQTTRPPPRHRPRGVPGRFAPPTRRSAPCGSGARDGSGVRNGMPPAVRPRRPGPRRLRRRAAGRRAGRGCRARRCRSRRGCRGSCRAGAGRRPRPAPAGDGRRPDGGRTNRCRGSRGVLQRQGQAVEVGERPVEGAFPRRRTA